MLSGSAARARRRQHPQKPARRRDLRAAILRAARRLYLADGPDGISARKIAQAVGVSATAVYLHFRSIDDLLDHLRMEGHELLAGYLRQPAALPPLERIRAMGRGYYRFGLEHPSWFTLMFHGPRRAARRPEAVQREMFTLMLLRDAVQSGVEARVIRGDVDALVITNALWAAIHGVTALAVGGLLVETSAGHTELVLGAVVDGALAGVVTPSRPATRSRRT